MDQQKFKSHLNDSVKVLLALQRQYSFNELADNCVFTITPNVRIPGKHLNELEITVLNNANKYGTRLLSADEVVALLHNNDKVPLWINMSVSASSAKTTVIDLNCSRRLRSENELNNADQYPPFKPMVVQPPDFLRKGNGKYDINWNRKYAQMTKEPGLLGKLVQFILS